MLPLQVLVESTHPPTHHPPLFQPDVPCSFLHHASMLLMASSWNMPPHHEYSTLELLRRHHVAGWPLLCAAPVQIQRMFQSFLFFLYFTIAHPFFFCFRKYSYMMSVCSSTDYTILDFTRFSVANTESSILLFFLTCWGGSVSVWIGN
jgi:hypothetical protein